MALSRTDLLYISEKYRSNILINLFKLFTGLYDNREDTTNEIIHDITRIDIMTCKTKKPSLSELILIYDKDQEYYYYALNKLGLSNNYKYKDEHVSDEVNSRYKSFSSGLYEGITRDEIRSLINKYF